MTLFQRTVMRFMGFRSYVLIDVGNEQLAVVGMTFEEASKHIAIAAKAVFVMCSEDFKSNVRKVMVDAPRDAIMEALGL